MVNNYNIILSEIIVYLNSYLCWIWCQFSSYYDNETVIWIVLKQWLYKTLIIVTYWRHYSWKCRYHNVNNSNLLQTYYRPITDLLQTYYTINFVYFISTIPINRVNEYVYTLSTFWNCLYYIIIRWLNQYILQYTHSVL